MSLLTIWSEEHFVFGIEPLWDELFWPLPLGSVVVQAMDVDLQFSTCLDIILTDICVFLKFNFRVTLDWVFKAEGLLHYHI